MKKNGPKRKILLRWTVSYVMILLIPFASFLFSYSKTMQSFKEELSDSNDFLLYTLSSNMDQVFLSIKNAVSFVLTNYTFQKTAQSSFQSPAMASDTVSKLRSALGNYVGSSEVDLGILIYYSGQSYIISNHAATDEKSFHRAQIYSGMTLSEKEWNDLLSQRYQSLDFFLSPFLRSESGEDCIVQAVTIRGYQENINLFVTVPVSAFTPHMNRLEQHTVCMQDQGGNVVTLFGDSSAVRQLDFSLPSGSSITGSDGKLYICNYAQSAVSGWHYAVVVSAENYWSRLRSAQSLNFLGVLLALFLGTCLVFLFLRQNYRPVHKIVGLLKPSAPYGNEFELIENSCRNLSDENSFMRDALNRQTAQLRERFLLSRLKGRGSPLIGSDYNAHFKIAEKGETLLLIVFSVGMSESARDGYRDELEYENMNLFAVDNIFSEMMDTYPYYRLEDGNLLMYLLHLDESAWHSWGKLGIPLLEKLCDIFTSKLAVPLAATVSTPAETLEELPYLYRSAMDAIEYCSTIGSTGVLTVADYQKQTETLQTRREEDHQELLHAVREGDATAGEAVLCRIFDEYTANASMTFPIFRLFLTEQLYAILSTYYEAVSDPSHREMLVKRSEGVIFSQDAVQLRDAFHDLVFFACNSVQAANAAAGNQLVQRICRYVQEHYQDNSLNINAIADALHHNPQYISRIFHAQMHNGLLDYISEVRIQHACSLMREQSITADELAEQVGFTNARTFRRAFSRVVGSTPGQYRQSET